MKKILLALLLLFFLASTGKAQEPDHRLYFPTLRFVPCQEVDNMSDFKVVVPVQTTNKCLNPSAETTGNFAATSGTTVTRETSTQHYGLYSYRIQSNLDDEGITLDLEALANTDHWVTMRVKGTLPAWEWSLDGSVYTAPALLETIDSEWKLYGLEFPAAEASGQTVLYIQQNGAGIGDYYLDGVQVEEGAWSTYCDGTQPGCEWTGAPHASASTRSPDSRAGGRVLDLEDDYGFNVSGMSGTGTAPQELFVDSYSQLPGGELNSRKVNSRVITLNGFIDGTDEADFWAKKEAIQALFDPEAFPEDENGEQPVRLRFVGANVHKEIAVFYEGGLETTITADDPACAREKVAVRFVADDPYWYEIGESAALLDTSDSDTFRYFAARLRSTGQWDNLGPPDVGGTYNAIHALAEDDTYIYIGGDFLDFDNIAAADYIARYNKATGTYSAMAALNGIVRAIAIAPNGNVYVGGEFTNASGVAAADYIAVWVVGASAWAAVGTPVTGTAAITRVNTLVFGGNGYLHIGGDFLNWNNNGTGDHYVYWTGSAYGVLGFELDGIVNDLAVSPDKTIIYLAGQFANYFASWDLTTYTTHGGILDDEALALAVRPDGVVYVGGAFTNFVYAWNGTVLTALPALSNDVSDLVMGPDGILYASGQFITGSGFTFNDGIARFNGAVWSPLDMNFGGGFATDLTILPGKSDPVVEQRYNLWLGFNTTGTGAFAGKITATNSGTAPAFPKVIFSRSGGTTATVQSLKNERTGLELFFYYGLLDGETLTIDLAPTQKSATSSFFGPRPNAILANSDLGEWSLSSGGDGVTSFVNTSGSPTITAWLLWKDMFKSQ